MESEKEVWDSRRMLDDEATKRSFEYDRVGFKP